MVESDRQAPSYEAFGEWVHEALNGLYDSPYLREHPLQALLPLEEEQSPERAQHLRRLILDAIRGLLPCPGTPADSSDWRGYRILELRYVDGLSPAEAMQELSLGRSQFFREQKYALDALTKWLWEAWQRRRQEQPSEAGRSRAALFSSALEQLAALATWESISPAQLWAELAPLAQALARNVSASVVFSDAHLPATIQTDRVLLRQALLDMIAAALRAAPGGRVEVGGFATEEESGLQVDVLPPGGQPASPGALGADVARQLTAPMGCTLRESRLKRCGWRWQLAWPVGLPTVLVIDDNEEFADLYRRFLAGRPWRVVGVASGREGLAWLAHTRPAVILLDVLMPAEDGWELLVTLKGRDETRDIPVVICSVLDQPDLALALGAAAYLAKPVTQQELVRTLAPWRRAVANPTPAG